MHELNTFFLTNAVQNTIQTNGPENPHNVPFHLGDVDLI